MKFCDPVTAVPFVGERYKKLLKNLEIKTVEDLLRHYPSRYEDFSQVRKISELLGGERATIRAEVLEIENIFTRYGKRLTKAVVRDESGTLLLVWFNQHYLTNAIHPKEFFHFSGILKSFSGQPALLSPEYEKITAGQLGSETVKQQNNEADGRVRGRTPEISGSVPSGRADRLIHTGRLVPIYPETAGVSSKWLRSRIGWILNNQQLTINSLEILPQAIRSKLNLIEATQAIRCIHFPRNQKEIEEGRTRLAFEEMFMLQLRALKYRRDWKEKRTAHSIQLTAADLKEKISKFVKSLPFALTEAQKRCVKEILSDLESEEPMNRLLQGDVGSGKTVVAATAAYAATLDGYQVAYMAPTEILAQQVFNVFKKYLAPSRIETSLQTGSNYQLSPINNQPQPNILVGTHALLHRSELFKNLALVIIDEQHRFGVKQRGKLLTTNNKQQTTPHLLTMTATPIPRSLALTTYGHLDVSVIDEMPPGVKPTKTWVVPEEKREAGYEWIKEKLKEEPAKENLQGLQTLKVEELTGLKNQAFIICPLIEESEHETLEDVKAVTTEFERLKKVFKDRNLGLLHGRMKSQEKEKIITNFRKGKTQILVSTPVVEVGMDIPQANIVVIEGAHRFGLASLHQLRGRVGRAGQESFCLLFTPRRSDRITRRLKALEKYRSGLKLAELDLKMRGPGEIYGVKQHGLPNLKIASLSDLSLIKATRSAAEEVIGELEEHPELKEKIEEKTDKIEPN